MYSRLVYEHKREEPDGAVTQIIVWEVPVGERSPEGVRYRLAYIPAGSREPAVLYDNHHPKGHHKHLQRKQYGYDYEDIPTLFEDFARDVEAWKKGGRD